MAPVALRDTYSGVEAAVKSKVAQSTTKDAAQTALLAAATRFEDANPKSKAQHEIAAGILPGGNTRTLLHTTPFPLSMKCGKGSSVWDEDDHKYTDFVGELTAGIFGHNHPVIREAIVSAFDNVGVSLGSTTIQEQKHASLICERFGLERLRFTNTGTEANLHALNGAKRFTGRRKVLVFSGGYHGAVLSFGDGKVAENNVDREEWVIGRYNDVDGAKRLIEETPELAAVLVEGMQGAGGCIRGTKEFLHTIQETTKKVGAVFILDEVMTSRIAPGGIQRLMGLKPDITSFGKYLGGGFPIGAFGGSEKIMRVYDPRVPGALSHSGTFNNNTMTMHAGYAGLFQVYTDEVNLAFNAKGDALLEKLQHVSKGTKVFFTGMGAILAAHFSDGGSQEVTCIEDFEERGDLRDLFWYEMLEDGFWITRRGFMALILGTPDEEMDRFVECVGKFLQRHKDILMPE
ncbi:pyridoxal phosphate-dependent transferase [Pseudomassariella vexata]|uniref:Pyridoxal phosphate-dependent transferase n=1 Tax=Pseudomassariella vexata TaxID=1141098 RepID=A0A1Y2DDB2_9PEZI|nr:pyridoxal phosphate-dependent transferase [Pseudomassariella vexata]ORY57272.1 pyridoxal phosphate-dependent transferase [Pseudomassariella vexata]